MKKQLLLLMMMLLPMMAMADDSGSCGDGVSFTFVDGTKTLTISGTGKMYDYDYPLIVPWQSYKEYITNIVIEDGVTSIGNMAFNDCTNLISVLIGNSVATIGCWALANCTKLSSVTIGDGVISIGEGSFYGCMGIKSITIPNSVISVGLGSFSYCGLTSLTIPKSLTTIEKDAFSGNSDLASIIVNEENPVYDSRDNCNAIVETSTNKLIKGCKNTIISNSISIIGENAYTGVQITSMDIPDNVTTIDESAFESCGVSSVNIGNGVTNIGKWAFRSCTKLESISFGNGIKNIGQLAFIYCNNLKKVHIHDIESWCKIYFEKYINKDGGSGYVEETYSSNPLYYANHLYLNGTEVKELIIPNTVEEISNAAFIRCNFITSVTIPNSVTSIGKYAFQYCTGLTSITIPNSVTSIGEEAFSYCSGLTSITIGNSVTSIGDHAFFYCNGLTSITIPNSVTSIGNSAFSNCSGLQKVIVKDIAAWCGISFSGETSNPLYYAHHLYNDENTEITELIIPNSVTSIGKYAFQYCTGLTSITIPGSVTSIGNDAFRGCSELTSIIVNAENTIYDSRDNCNALIETTSNTLILGCASSVIPSSIGTIGKSAFQGCKGLITLNIPDGVVSIDEFAFADCNNLIKLTIPSSLYYIQNRAFVGCGSFNEVYSYAENPPTTSEYALDKKTLESGTLHVYDDAIEKYRQSSPWNRFRSIVGLGESGGGSGTTPEKCATPTIKYIGGKLMFECETEGVDFVYSITTPANTTNQTGNNVDMPHTNTVSVYAKKSGYLNSDVATENIDVRGLKGDVTSDGQVTITDAVEVVNIIMGKAE